MGLVKPGRSHRFIGPLAFSTHNPWWCPNGPVPLPLRKGKPYLDHVGKHHLGTYHLERFQPNNAGTVIMCRGRIMISDDFRTSIYYRGSRFLVPHLAFCWVGPEFCGDICCKIHKERDIPVQTFLDEKWSQRRKSDKVWWRIGHFLREMRGSGFAFNISHLSP